METQMWSVEVRETLVQRRTVWVEAAGPEEAKRKVERGIGTSGRVKDKHLEEARAVGVTEAPADLSKGTGL